MNSLFISTLNSYALAILPWFALGIFLAYILEKNFRPRIIKKYFGASDYRKILIAQVLGMVSPLSIMSFLPIANEFIASGAHPGMIYSFFIAERAYDLQSFFIITSLFGPKFAILNAGAILISLLVSALAIRNDHIVFRVKPSGEKPNFWSRQTKLLVIVIIGITIGAFLRVVIPTHIFSNLTGSTYGGIAGGSIIGFLLYFGPILGNYPVAKAFFDLGMSQSGIFAFLTISPVINLVVIMLFSGAVGFKNTYKAFVAYFIAALGMTLICAPFL
ncbi:MAG: hypothetical protein RI947_796 [Candidatus Parcubacteria bacterium]|jgi:uncharacterized membrane protein YraQ (UPF0718 family)